MTWEFAIIDRNNVETIIEEPIGFDSVQLSLKRDEEWHGVFLEVGGQNLQYIGVGKQILKKEYDTHGAAGIATLVIRQQCAGKKIELERYSFLFISYEYVCGDYCYVTCPVETNSEAANLRNKYSQKVDLETTKAFDGKTVLPPYAKLPFDLELPSKGILLKDIAIAETDITTPVLGVVRPVPDSEYGSLELAMDKISSSEIGSFFVNSDAFYKEVDNGSGFFAPGVFVLPGAPLIKTKPLVTSPIINFYDGSPGYNDVNGVINTDIKSKITITPLNGAGINNVAFVIAKLPDGRSGDVATDYEWIQIDVKYSAVGSNFTTPQTYTAQYTEPNFIINKGDRIYCYWTIYNYKGVGVDPNDNAFEIKHWKDDSYWRMNTITHTKPTTSKVFMVNEAISRTVEAITNDKLRAYSYYFGRTDSQPYAFAEDGCGSLEAITDGLRVRRAEMKDGTNKAVYSMSLQDEFESLNAIHNIGMGIEPDENREGFNRLRVEPWKHFYSDEVIMVCDGVKKITTKINRKHVFSGFQFGYSKWEAEEYTGLDEFLTKRNYRTKLDLLSNTMTKLCKMIGSGYASEITRRKGNLDSKDWRYDKESFIYCLTRERKFRVTFRSKEYSGWIPRRATIYIDTTMDPTPFAGLTSITVSGSGSNDGTYTVERVTFFEGYIRIKLGASEVLTNEVSYSVTFPSVTLPAGIFVELGGITTPENIIDPETIYNYRISPFRMAMRWFNKIAASYKFFDINSVLIFMDGDGNYFAKGKLEDDCALERIAVQENEQIDLSKFDDAMQAQPFASPERKSFQYPMSVLDFRKLKANPKGLIQYIGCETGEGWIDQVQYKAKEGLAEFTLIPKIN